MTRLLVCLFMFSMACGCGQDRPERVPVSGTVLIDGKRLPNCTVQFVPAQGRASYGRTDEQGHFSLTCYEDEDGVVRGTHRVAVVAKEDIDGSTIHWNAPKKYIDHRTSGLEFAINEPVNDLKIELTWEGGRPFTERDGEVRGARD